MKRERRLSSDARSCRRADPPVGGDGLAGFYSLCQPLKTYGQFEQIVSAVRKSHLPREEPQDRSAIPALLRSRHPHQTRHGRVRIKLLTSKLRDIIVNGEFRGVAIGCHSVARRTRSARRPGLRGGDAIRKVHALGASRRRQIIGLTLSSHTLSCSTSFSSDGGFRDDYLGGVIRPVYRPAPSRTPHGFLCSRKTIPRQRRRPTNSP